MIQYLINILFIFLPGSRFFAFKRFLLFITGVKVGKNVRVMRIRIEGIKLNIGENTYIGDETIITGGESNVTIGKNCDISSRVSIVTGNHKIGNIEHAAGIGYSEDIVIGDGVWIGYGVIILSGVTIGKGSIIGAGSVVTTDIPSGVMAAGVPAKVKKVLFENSQSVDW
jgi:maltose O-acetyltransferase